jgi:hypothetical protein
LPQSTLLRKALGFTSVSKAQRNAQRNVQRPLAVPHPIKKN